MSSGLSSASNLLTTIWVARSLPPEDFGKFAIMYSLGLFVVGFHRLTVGDVLLKNHGSGRPTPTFTSSNLYVTVQVLAIVVVGRLFLSAAYAELLVLGVLLGGTLLNDRVRLESFARGSPIVAVVMDALWVGVAAVLLITVSPPDVLSAHTYWALTGTVLAAIGAVLLIRPGAIDDSPTYRRSILREPLVLPLAAEFLLSAGVGRLLPIVLGSVGSFAIVAALQGIATLAGAFNAFFQGLRPSLLADDQLGRRGWAWLRKGPVQFGVLIVLWTLTIRFVVTDDIGRILLGDSWSLAASLVWPWALYLLGNALILVPSIRARIDEQGKVLIAFRIATSVATLGAATVAALTLQTPSGVGWALGAVNLTAGLSWLTWFLHRRRQSTTPSAPLR